MAKQKTILTTGGAGFIASHFIRLLYDRYPNYKIIVLDALTYAGNLDNIPKEIKNDRDRFEFWHGNIQDIDIVDNLVSQSDIVVHFAAESHVARSIFDNKTFYLTDVMGTQTITNAILKHIDKIEKFIHISTSEVYGTAEGGPMSEEHPINPTTPYASAKAGADRLVYSYWKTYGIPATIIRPFNNYGPNQHLEKVVPRFITSALLDEPLTIHGKGKFTRDWIYVEDNCEAILNIIKASKKKIIGEVFNIGSGRDISILKIAQIVLKKMNKSEKLVQYSDARLGQVDRHIADISKIKKVIGWQPKVKFEQGVEKTIAWYDKNRDWWKDMRWMKSIPIKGADGKIITKW